MPVGPFRTAFLRLYHLLHGSGTLIINSGAMAAGTIVTAALGLLYWWLAARAFPPAAIGKASALLSVMGLIGLLGEAGLGTLLIGEITTHRSKAPGLIAAAALVGTALGVLLALTFAFVTQRAGLAGPTSWVEVSAFVAGCGLTVFHMVTLQGLVGNLNGGGRTIELVLFSLMKLLLIATAAAVGARSDTAIVLTWPFGIVASWFCFDLLTAGGARRLVGRPDFELLHELRHKVVGHYALDVVMQAPAVVMPYVVLVLLSPDTNAAFAAIWMVVSTASMIPAVAATVLFPVVRADPSRYKRDLLVSLTMSLLFSLACAIFVLAYSKQMLAFFNPAYATIAGSDLRFLGFGLLGLTLKFHFCALARLRNRMGKAAGLFAALGALELAMSIAGAKFAGLEGLVLGWMLAVSIEGAFALVMFAFPGKLDGVAAPSQREHRQASGGTTHANERNDQRDLLLPGAECPALPTSWRLNRIR
jgi:O-antigen/teichoic acid export membrane protein